MAAHADRISSRARSGRWLLIGGQRDAVGVGCGVTIGGVSICQ
jgi:hypothetical protein